MRTFIPQEAMQVQAEPHSCGCGMARKRWESVLLSLLLIGTLASLSKAGNGTQNFTLVSGSGEHGTESEEVHEGEEGPCQQEMERAFDSEVRIARVDFEKVRVPMIVTLFIVVVVVAKMSKLLFICSLFYE